MTIHPHGTARAALVALGLVEDALGGGPVELVPHTVAPGPAGHTRAPNAGLLERAAELELDEGQLALGMELARLLPEPVRIAHHDAFVGLVAALRLAESRGSTRLPLDGSVLDEHLEALGLGAAERALARELCTRPKAFAPVVGAPGDRAPLIVDADAVGSHRLHVLEARVASTVLARVRTSDPATTSRSHLGAIEAASGVPGDVVDDAALDAALADVLARPSGTVTLSAAQRAAVRSSARGRLALVSGEPGTGKTSIVVSMLRVSVRLGIAPDRIALAAPTGKAADRMRSSILRALDAIGDPSPEDRALRAHVPESQTLHRLLGYSPATGRFRQHERNPLGQRVILVDESSMIGVALIDRLLRAASPEARVVLLGDAQQLPSVEAGAVFRDLCAALAGDADDASGSRDGSRTRPVARLTESFRMREDDPDGRHVLGVARAMNVGDEALVLAEVRRPGTLDRLGGHGVELVSGSDLPSLLAAWERIAPPSRDATRAFDVIDGRPRPRELRRLRTLFDGLDRARLLCVTRGRRTGVLALNELAHTRHLARSGRDRGPRFAAGEPVLVTRNDYERGLYNGDQGLVILAREGRGPVRRLAAFRRGDEDFMTFPIEVVESRLELAYAVTVHKAQGSEHERVAIVLPEEPAPLLTRELLYTAVTRARRHVLIFGEEARLIEGVRRRVERQSALATRLR
ncbi:MAG: exodeoxyribonuclease V subunit alpha [Myxococcota bacterium]|nr:exodeoxyribonuclease V subunit alpha [Myxococcota bacterium]